MISSIGSGSNFYMNLNSIGNGSIDQSEFEAFDTAMKSRMESSGSGGRVSESQSTDEAGGIEELFSKLDTDSSGTIDEEELSAMKPPPPPPPPGGGGMGGMSTSGASSLASLLEQLESDEESSSSELDTNGDGTVDASEMAAALQAYGNMSGGYGSSSAASGLLSLVG